MKQEDKVKLFYMANLYYMAGGNLPKKKYANGSMVMPNQMQPQMPVMQGPQADFSSTKQLTSIGTNPAIMGATGGLSAAIAPIAGLAIDAWKFNRAIDDSYDVNAMMGEAVKKQQRQASPYNTETGYMQGNFANGGKVPIWKMLGNDPEQFQMDENNNQQGGGESEAYKEGGLSRSKDYGSEKKPYPMVKGKDFAGGNRSYPIPTKADAVDALRLAGLHGRSDVKAKVYAKYPELKHADGGGIGYSIERDAILNNSSAPYAMGGYAEGGDMEDEYGIIPGNGNPTADDKNLLAEDGAFIVPANRVPLAQQMLMESGYDPYQELETMAPAAKEGGTPIRISSKEMYLSPDVKQDLQLDMGMTEYDWEKTLSPNSPHNRYYKGDYMSENRPSEWNSEGTNEYVNEEHDVMNKQKLSPTLFAMGRFESGGYTVKRSNDREGKTHVVIGPDGTKKYFGDSKLGQHPNDPERKKAFYARHRENLQNNPYFKAYAEKTWAEGGPTDDEYAKGGKMIKRADGSYSRRGLWDNIRANKGSGKEPTKEMLEQEKKIKDEYAMGGMMYAGGGKLPDEILLPRLKSHMSSEEANNYINEYVDGGGIGDWWYNNMRSQKYRDENFSPSEMKAMRKEEYNQLYDPEYSSDREIAMRKPQKRISKTSEIGAPQTGLPEDFERMNKNLLIANTIGAAGQGLYNMMQKYTPMPRPQMYRPERYTADFGALDEFMNRQIQKVGATSRYNARNVNQIPATNAAIQANQLENQIDRAAKMQQMQNELNYRNTELANQANLLNLQNIQNVNLQDAENRFKFRAMKGQALSQNIESGLKGFRNYVNADFGMSALEQGYKAGQINEQLYRKALNTPDQLTPEEVQRINAITGGTFDPSKLTVTDNSPINDGGLNPPPITNK